MIGDIVLGGKPPGPPPRYALPRAPYLPGRSVRVLVVDDEPSICRAFVTALKLVGYDATAAETGDAAIEILRAEHVDVLLIDLRIPGMRGDVVFNVGVAHQPHLQQHTLFMTGDITEHAQKLIASCNCPYLRKPFDLADLFDAIGALSPRVEDEAG